MTAFFVYFVTNQTMIKTTAMIDHVAIRIFVRLMRTSFSSLTSFINDIWSTPRFLISYSSAIHL